MTLLSKSLIIGLAISIQAQAGLLELTAGSNKVEGVSVSSSAKMTTPTPATLTTFGAGLRAKKVVFVNVKVYVGEFFVADKASFKKDQALTSVAQQPAAAIRLHFLRDVDSANIEKSFIEALSANKVDAKDAAIAEFLAAVRGGGEAKENSSMTIAAQKVGADEFIHYESPSGKLSSIKGSAGFIQKIFSIWFGQPADSGIADLQSSILKGL